MRTEMRASCSPPASMPLRQRRPRCKFAIMRWVWQLAAISRHHSLLHHGVLNTELVLPLRRDREGVGTELDMVGSRPLQTRDAPAAAAAAAARRRQEASRHRPACGMTLTRHVPDQARLVPCSGASCSGDQQPLRAL